MDKTLTLEDVREIAKNEMAEAIKNNLDSALIFQYISGLEETSKKQKEALSYINRLIDKIVDENKTFDMLAVLMTLKTILESEAK